MPTGRLASSRAAALFAALFAALGALLVALAIAVPRLRDENVQVNWPPLHSDWMPRFGGMSLVAIAVGVTLWVALPRLTARLSWPGLLVTTYASTWAWIMALVFVDGPGGLSRMFEYKSQYVYDAQHVGSITHMLRTFIDHIPSGSTTSWHTHVAGHPPGALLFFVLLDRLGLTSHLWIGVVVVSLGATAVVAVLIALRETGDAHLARRAAPWLALAPSAIWMGVYGDALYTAVAAWGLCFLVLAATRKRRSYAVAGGLLLGLCVYFSYGLVLLAIPALAVVWLTRSWRMIPWAIGGGLVVVAAFTAFGFFWWEAYPVLVERYYAGVASKRAYSYWVWADIAAWTFTVGLAVWAVFPSLPAAVKRRNPVAVFASAMLLSIFVATLTGMSKAEVERIWLPFTVWIVVLPVLLPNRWQRPLLLSQVVLALVVQHLLLKAW